MKTPIEIIATKRLLIKDGIEWIPLEQATSAMYDYHGQFEEERKAIMHKYGVTEKDVQNYLKQFQPSGSKEESKECEHCYEPIPCDMECEQESKEQVYTLNCDKCGKTFQSSVAFPEPHICPTCYI